MVRKNFKGKKIIEGVSKEVRRKLEKVAKINEEKFERKILAQRMKLIKKIRKEIRPTQKVLAKCLLKQPEYLKYNRELNLIFREVNRKNISCNEARLRRNSILELNRRYRPIFDKAIKLAPINYDRTIDTILKALGPFFKNICYDTDVLYFVGSTSFEELVLAGEETVDITSPYEIPYTWRHNEGWNGGTTDVNEANVILSTGNFAMEGHSIASDDKASHGRNSAKLGRYITIPSGYTKLRVTSRIAARHEYTLITTLGAQALANIWARISLTGSNNESQHAQFELYFLLAESAPNNINGDAETEYVVSGEFDIPSIGGEFIVLSGGWTWFNTYAQVAPQYPSGFRAESYVSLQGTVKKITLELVP